MKMDFEKIGLISSYFSKNTHKLYVTKLFKLLYYVDFIAYAKRGASVTGDVYYKLPYGPVPTCTKNEIDLLSMESLLGKDVISQLSKYLVLCDDEAKLGKLVVSRVKDENLYKKLSAFELKLIEAVAKRFENTGAKQLSEKTHKEKPWLLSSSNAPIDYVLANELDVHSILPEYSGR